MSMAAGEYVSVSSRPRQTPPHGVIPAVSARAPRSSWSRP
jgi:hypothetical protein